MNFQVKIAKSVTALSLAAAVLLTGWSGTPNVKAASNAVPSYEVKFLLDASKVLNSNGLLQSSVTSAFDVDDPAEKQLVEYFDTDALDLNESGWNVRFRKKEDKKKYELTYKKRFSITNGDIDAALTAANKAGFDSSDDNYEAEIDWGYSKQTLSFSNDKEESASKGLSVPSESKALDILVDNIPGKLEDTNSKGWGKDTLKDSRAHGPVTVDKYEGEFNGLETDIEVMPVKTADGKGMESVIEISFKTDSYSEASSNRAELMSLLDSKGWLVHADSLKTNLVLERY
ncbi:hypothetical protein [Paenibacillus physcomitrellae]|uniref:CYTH domain-containing protein n=1 Tax=Paenibacillus physcomitrellae TaxID=1619311 RepID=A0ABQ1GNE5_9BACL|nr:hypothetical protein [Paenibacillus physcomitrellae]GGA47260.1 hypothetical protein GCM10010917_35670 [Paenibacillus physcomitrellae]